MPFLPWLPSLAGNTIGSLWAANPADDVYRELESYLGPYCPDMIDEWAMDDEIDANEMSEHMPPCPDIWSDGSKIQDPVSKIETAGA